MTVESSKLQSQHLRVCVFVRTDTADVPAVEPARNFATAACTRISLMCPTGDSDSVDLILLHPHTTVLDAAIECCCVLDLGLCRAWW